MSAKPASITKSRQLAKKITPLRVLYGWWFGVWADLHLYLLTMLGYVPSHRLRNLVYRWAGVKLHPTSSLHWRARFFNPRGLSIGPYTTIGNDGFFDARDGITIGACVNISGDVRIYTREHDID